MKVLKVIWFTEYLGETIGIVCVKNEMDEIKFYIGTGKGDNEEEDIKHILECGQKINPEYIDRFFERN